MDKVDKGAIEKKVRYRINWNGYLNDQMTIDEAMILINEAMESYSASQNSGLKKENEELKATIIKGEKYLETVSEQLGAAIEDYNKEKDLCREQQRTIDELCDSLSDLYLSVVDKDFYNSHAIALKNSQSLLSKLNTPI